MITSFSLAKAQSYDNLQVSLLTVKPSSIAVYTIYGHTALRLYDPSNNTDIVLNWGMFDSHAPNFLFHFVKGETDYYFTTMDYSSFFLEYSWKNTTITEQILSIPNENKAAFIQMIALNLKPENRNYRYNFLFDNCTTRPRDIIEKCCGGKLAYPVQTEKTTFRDLIHSCTNPYPWMTFGIDLLIGSGADSLISIRQELFLPEKLMDALEQAAVIAPNGAEFPLVVSSKVILQSSDDEVSQLAFWDSPLLIASIIFLIYMTLVIVGYITKRRFRLPFALLFFVAGIGGCLVATICFFSIHPCTSPNWNILWLHPLHLIGFVGFLLKKSYPLFRWYHGINFVLLSGFLLGWHWIPQELNPACIPFILCLWIISGKNLKFQVSGLSLVAKILNSKHETLNMKH
ncbi:membrane protein [Bacteroidia bacterium]|nr:membrane protein [Bacteroidia bacterium]